MGGGDFGALPAPALQCHQHPVALAGTGAVISKFNRDTMVLTVGLLGTVIFAALVLAVQELHPKTAVVTDEPNQTGGDLSLNANPIALAKIAGLNAKHTGETTSDPATNLDEGFNPENTQTGPHANARSWSAARPQGSVREIRPKIPRVRTHPSLWAKLADLKMRLFAFWHRKFAPAERSRGWTQFSNKGERKKVSYTAETNH
jgi:hypothetical protein